MAESVASPTPAPVSARALAIEAHRRGELAQAEALYRAALAQAAHDAVAAYNLGILLLAQARLEGLAFVQQALEAPPGTLDRHAAAASAAQALANHRYLGHAMQFVAWLEARGLAAPEHEALWRRCRLPAHLSPVAPGSPAPQPLRRYPPMESERYVYAIDIVGGCNLRCPTCPVGQGAALAKGLMALPLFEQVLAKIVHEHAPHRPDIWLFNWGEPLLHPQVASFVRATHAAGLTSFISTNLNHGERIDELMQAGPTRLKVSLSSFEQARYGLTHARGQIERVKRNLRSLAAARERHRASAQIWIGHHLYRHTASEQAEVQAFAQALGMGYAPSQAIVAPIETAIALAEGAPAGAGAAAGGPAAAATQALVNELITHPREIQQHMHARRSGHFDCELRFNMTTMDHLGHVGLCCGTTQPLGAVPVPFLELPHAEIERRKYAHAFCARCMGAQMHLTTADR